MEEEIDVDDRQDVVIEQKPGMLSNAPWWMVSVGIHAVLILGATLVAIERLVALDDGGTFVNVTGPAAPVIQEIERKRDVFTRAGLPKDEQEQVRTDEPAIFFPEAKESDHNESADNEDYKKMKGDSEKYLSYIKGDSGGFRGKLSNSKSQGVYDAMGVGPGAGSGGRFGGRLGGRENLVAKGGGGEATESAVT